MPLLLSRIHTQSQSIGISMIRRITVFPKWMSLNSVNHGQNLKNSIVYFYHYLSDKSYIPQ